MKVVLNMNFGGFIIPDDVYDRLGIDYRSELATDIVWRRGKSRSDPKVVEAFEESNNYWKERGEPLDDIVIAVIPDESTDFLITEYDGMETLYYVLDGKIHACNTFILNGEEEVTDDDLRCHS